MTEIKSQYPAFVKKCKVRSTERCSFGSVCDIDTSYCPRFTSLHSSTSNASGPGKVNAPGMIRPGGSSRGVARSCGNCPLYLDCETLNPATCRQGVSLPPGGGSYVQK